MSVHVTVRAVHSSHCHRLTTVSNTFCVICPDVSTPVIIWPSDILERLEDSSHVYIIFLASKVSFQIHLCHSYKLTFIFCAFYEAIFTDLRFTNVVIRLCFIVDSYLYISKLVRVCYCNTDIGYWVSYAYLSLLQLLLTILLYNYTIWINMQHKWIAKLVKYWSPHQIWFHLKWVCQDQRWGFAGTCHQY